ncbi:AbiH family protein [Sporosarcina sp. UB5]|uniref:AbiH family protein n=1 Tax=Sporosarcina sp. UB5 TaxID=3047463 RepID=UPI003D7B04E2
MTEEYLRICEDCGTPYFTAGEQAFYESKNLTLPKRCKKCRTARKQEWEQEQKAKKLIEQAGSFKQALNASHFKSVSIGRMPTGDPSVTLNVIGNGFDLMHGVKSSYYNFRDSLGKNNSLRFALETYLNVEDVWADFEDALAHINSGAMFEVIDMWLGAFDAYNPDAQAADFFVAVDAATGPSQTITNDLPRRFRMWVESLKLPDMTYRPLNGVIRNSNTLNFNYTEFIEELYGVEKENVCYIHGCRRKEKYHPKDKLILGHVPGAGDDDLVGDYKLPKYKNSRKRERGEAAIDTASRNLSWYDEETTKNCKEIIKNNKEFFDGLSDVSRIIIVGHSLSPVDWDYFKKIINVNKNKKNIEWFISCHSARNIESIKMFADAMGIKVGQITLFIT